MLSSLHTSQSEYRHRLIIILTREGYGKDPSCGRVPVKLEQDLVGRTVCCFLDQAPGEDHKLWCSLLWTIPAFRNEGVGMS